MMNCEAYVFLLFFFLRKRQRYLSYLLNILVYKDHRLECPWLEKIPKLKTQTNPVQFRCDYGLEEIELHLV